ncbi:hypothetical protein JTB14_029233 [Gonioctena quinquepunctata]|nr:hypothetical protein JTB14_029233 [Gonioctena quinquepunctata]
MASMLMTYCKSVKYAVITSCRVGEHRLPDCISLSHTKQMIDGKVARQWRWVWLANGGSSRFTDRVVLVNDRRRLKKKNARHRLLRADPPFESDLHSFRSGNESLRPQM